MLKNEEQEQIFSHPRKRSHSYVSIKALWVRLIPAYHWEISPVSLLGATLTNSRRTPLKLHSLKKRSGL